MSLKDKIKRRIINLVSPNIIYYNILRFVLDLFIYNNFVKVRRNNNYIKIKKINFIKFLSNNKNYINNIRTTFSHNNYEKSIDECSDILGTNGAIIIENAFLNETINKFKSDTDHLIKEKSQKIDGKFVEYNEDIIPLKNDPFLLSNIILNTIEKSIKFKSHKASSKKIFVREATRLMWFNPTRENIKTYWAAGWHVDTPTQFAAHVILNDINSDDTRMQLMPKSHDFPFIPSKHYLFDENDNFKKNIKSCTGKAGTLYIHKGTTLHRNFPVIDSSRYLWGATYTTDKVFYSVNESQSKTFFKETNLENISEDNLERLKVFQHPVKDEVKNSYFTLDTNNKIVAAKKEDISYV